MSIPVAGAIMAHNAERGIREAIDSLVTAQLDRILVLVDDRSEDSTLAFAEERAAQHANVTVDRYTFTMAGGFGVAYTDLMYKAMDLAGTDWVFILDADETIDAHQSPEIRKLAAAADYNGVDCVGVPRRAWWNLARTAVRAEWFPDHQWRLLKRGVSYRWRVHPSLEAKKFFRLDPEELTIHHFNLVYRPDDAAWAPTNKFYAELLALDHADGRPR